MDKEELVFTTIEDLIRYIVNKGKSIGQCLKDRTNYAKNGEKTQNGQYVSAYACDPETVDQEFLLSKKEYLRITGRQIPGDIIAYQIRQSFKPGGFPRKRRTGSDTKRRYASHTGSTRSSSQPIRTASTSTITSSLIPPISPATGNLRTAGSSPSRCRD